MADLGEFLRVRRSRISPASAGLPGGVRRRVPGLRREELAQLAGISVEYYQRLEQGRASSPSPQVLAAIADVLRLSPVERDHLRVLAASHRFDVPPAVPLSVPSEEVTEVGEQDVMERVVEALKVPALAINDRCEVLVANRTAQRLFGHAESGWNMARWLFFDPSSRDFYVHWEDVAAATAAQLRFLTARYPDDAVLEALVAELRAGSGDFEDYWARGDVAVRTQGRKSFRHPALGVLTFDYAHFPAAGDPRSRLVVFTPEPGSPTEAAIQLLNTWAGAETPQPGSTRR